MPPAPARTDLAEARIGIVLWRVRSKLARTAAGRPLPQVEPFRRPTAIPLDPKPTSAALVVTDFVTKVLRKTKAQTGEGCRVVVLVLDPVQPGGSDGASSIMPTRSAGLRQRYAHGSFLVVS